MRLTAKERILLHLLDHVGHAEALEVPAAMTQDGLAAAAWVDLRHLAQYVRPLVREGQIRERMAHVRGSRQRRKVYDLSDAGRLAAIRLRDRVKSELVSVRETDGVRSVPLGEVSARVGRSVALLDLLRRAQAGPLDLERLAAPAPAAFVEFISEAPRVDSFVGRDRELGLVASPEERPKVFAVRGVAGIGKSTFAAKACSLLRGRSHLYWHRVRPWDTEVALLAGLGEFLAALGRPGLRSIVARGEASRWAQVFREEIAGTPAVLVYDDLHEGGPDLVPFFRGLKDAVADAPGVRVIALTRRSVPFYDRRDVSLHGLVREIDLGGLGKEDVTALFAEEAPAVADAARGLGGHPLFLQLLRAAPPGAATPEVRRDIRRFIEETIYAELSTEERKMMKVASLYGVPVPRDALLADPSLSHDVLLSLEARALLMAVGSDRYVVHDTIQAFFADALTPSERRDLAPFAVAQLRALADAAFRNRKFLASLDFLSNALRLAASPAEGLSIREAMGDVYERLGVLPDVLIAYKEALKDARDPTAIARLRRKTAAALAFKGEASAALREVEAGLAVLRGGLDAERGWLDLVRCRVTAQGEEWEEAKEFGELALGTFHALGDVRGKGEARLELGIIEVNAPRGRPQAAQDHLESALGIAERLADPEAVARVRTQLAHLFAYRLGDEARAREHIDAVLRMPEALADARFRRPLLMLEGWVSLELRGDFDAAESHFREAMVLGRRTYDGFIVGFARYGLATTAYFRGRIGEARVDFERCVAELTALGQIGTAAEALWLVAECSLLLGDIPGFRRVVDAFQDPAYARGVESRTVLAFVLKGLDAVLRRDGPSVRMSFEAALRSAEEASSPQEWPLVHFAHFFYGISLKVMGDAAEGERHLEMTRAFLSAFGLRTRLSVMPDREARLAEVLSTAPAPG